MSRPGASVARARLFLDLALAGLRGSPARTLVGILVAALTVAILATGLSLRSVSELRDDRVEMRAPVVGVAEATGNDLLHIGRTSLYEGRPIAVHEVAVVGTTGLRPAGLARIPAPGELAASPAMAELLQDPDGTLAQRFPGRISQTIAPESLVGPDELVLVVSRPAAEIGPDAVPVIAFGEADTDSISPPAELGPAQALLVVGFLIPLLAMLVTTSTIGGAQRDRRLAALRLLGLSARQAKLVTAGETGLIAVLGVAGGLLLFGVLRGPLAPLVPVNGGVWPGDVYLEPVQLIAICLAVPALALGATLASLGSVSVTPLAVFRRAASRTPAAWRIAPLVLGATGLAASLLPERLLPVGLPARSLLVVVSIGLCILGLLTGSAWIAHRAARPAERLQGGVGLSLAVRQVSQAAARSSRTVTGLACLVAVSGLLLSFFPLFSDATASSQRSFVEEVGAGLLITGVDAGADIDVAALRATPGVTDIAVLRIVPVRPVAPPVSGAGKDDHAVAGVLAADCADLEAVLGVPSRNCRRGLALREASAFPALVQAGREAGNAKGGTPVVPVGAAFPTPARAEQSRTATLAAESYGLPADFVMSPQSLPSEVRRSPHDFPAQLLVRQDGSHLEEVRTAVTLAVPHGEVLTTGERLAIAEKSTRTFRGLTVTAIACAVVVGLLSLLTATVDQVREQGRVLSTLWVVGLSPRSMRATVLFQFLLVTVPALVVAFAVALLAATAYLNLADDPPPVPVWSMAGVSLAAAAAAVVAAAAVMPLLRPARLAALPRE